jgi:hypothetical protein
MKDEGNRRKEGRHQSRDGINRSCQMLHFGPDLPLPPDVQRQAHRNLLCALLDLQVFFRGPWSAFWRIHRQEVANNQRRSVMVSHSSRTPAHRSYMLWLSLLIVNEKQQWMSGLSEPAVGLRKVQLVNIAFCC